MLSLCKAVRERNAKSKPHFLWTVPRKNLFEAQVFVFLFSNWKNSLRFNAEEWICDSKVGKQSLEILHFLSIAESTFTTWRVICVQCCFSSFQSFPARCSQSQQAEFQTEVLCIQIDYLLGGNLLTNPSAGSGNHAKIVANAFCFASKVVDKLWVGK